MEEEGSGLQIPAIAINKNSSLIWRVTNNFMARRRGRVDINAQEGIVAASRLLEFYTTLLS